MQRGSLKWCLLGLVAGVGLTGVLARGQEPAPPVGFEALLGFDQLPWLVHWPAFQDSSYDRKNLNQDAGNFLRVGTQWRPGPDGYRRAGRHLSAVEYRGSRHPNVSAVPLAVFLRWRSPAPSGSVHVGTFWEQGQPLALCAAPFRYFRKRGRRRRGACQSLLRADSLFQALEDCRPESNVLPCRLS